MQTTQSTSTRVVFHEILTNTAQTHCPISSYVTLTLNGSTMGYDLRNSTSDTNSLSTGSLTKE